MAGATDPSRSWRGPLSSYRSSFLPAGSPWPTCCPSDRSDHALRPQRRDLRLRTAKARQHLVGVLAQTRRRGLDARAAMSVLERGQRHRDRTLDAVDLRVLVQYAADLQLGIGQ